MSRCLAAFFRRSAASFRMNTGSASWGDIIEPPMDIEITAMRANRRRG